MLQNCTLERIGSAYDGGYLMCGNLLGGIQSAYSYGIGPADDWGCAISRRHGIPVHQVPTASTRRRSPVTVVRRSSTTSASVRGGKSSIWVFDTLTDQIAKNGDAGKTLVVKIDVEGAELESVLATSDRVLDRMDQLAMEIHGTDARFLELVRS